MLFRFVPVPFAPLALVALALLLPATRAGAQGFRIETEVIQESTGETISENLTLFDDNVIVDFMLRPDQTRFPLEIVAYVPSQKRFILMDTTRRVKTEIIESELLKILAALQGAAFVNDDNRFWFHPEFNETWDPASGWLELRSPQLVYRTRGKRPAQDVALHRYLEFIDQFARLNATDPRRMPSFPRLKLNQSIRKYGFIPEVVEMTIVPNDENSGEPIAMTSRHVTMWELSQTDRERIESAKRYWMEFNDVSMKEYRRLTEPTAETAGKSARERDIR